MPCRNSIGSAEVECLPKKLDSFFKRKNTSFKCRTQDCIGDFKQDCVYLPSILSLLFLHGVDSYIVNLTKKSNWNFMSSGKVNLQRRKNPHPNLLSSPTAAADPQEGRGGFWDISPAVRFPIILLVILSLNCSLHARVAHSRHKVLPVPVGLSSTPLFF